MGGRYKRTSPWPKAVVTKTLPSRSYEVMTDKGNAYRRNRVHLKKTKETFEKTTDDTVPIDDEQEQLPVEKKPKEQVTRKQTTKTGTNAEPAKEPKLPVQEQKITRSGHHPGI